MSAGAYLVIRCDAADDTAFDSRCGSEGHWPVQLEPHTHQELRRLLKTERGWRRTRDGRDLCPDHAGRPVNPTSSSPARTPACDCPGPCSTHRR